jgi:hypothetical protein
MDPCIIVIMRRLKDGVDAVPPEGRRIKEGRRPRRPLVSQGSPPDLVLRPQVGATNREMFTAAGIRPFDTRHF